MEGGPTFAVVIPARLASRRLPRKVLLRQTGKYLVQHVWERLLDLKEAEAIVIATDSQEVFEAARSFGAQVRLTSSDHPSGTDRVAEVARDLEVSVVVNVQGDEPTIQAEDVRRLVKPFGEDEALVMTTLARRRNDKEGKLNPNIVKVVTDLKGMALYFSRSPIPSNSTNGTWLHHVGVYAYRREFLLKLGSLEPTPLEGAERLEQLRVLEHGYRIQVVETENRYEGIDTPEQYRSFVQAYLQGKLQ